MDEDTHSEVYAELAAVGPYGVHPGHALITMVEPHATFPREVVCDRVFGIPSSSIRRQPGADCAGRWD